MPTTRTAAELWVGYHKKATGRPSVTWSEAVDEALCVGWIDGVRYSLDDERSAQRFTPRRKGSTWSAVNVAKVAALTEAGRMRPGRPGRLRGAVAREDRDLLLRASAGGLQRRGAGAFRAHAARLGRLGGPAAQSYRRTVTHWVTSAKQAATRERRFAALIEDSAAGQPVGPMRFARRTMNPAIAAALADALDRLRTLELGDAFEPRAAEAIVGRGPASPDGAGRGRRSRRVAWPRPPRSCRRSGRSTGRPALGFAMQVHVVGRPPRRRHRSRTGCATACSAPIVDDGALVNNAATEEGGGSPARGAIPGTLATLDGVGTWRLTGEKTWTTWLPNLTHAFVSARIDGGDAATPEVGSFLVDLSSPGSRRREGFEALGMRGSASGRLALEDVPGELVQRRRTDEPDARGAAPGAWFAAAVAATYLGVGEGARSNVSRWAIERRPGDGSTSVAEVPSVQVRLGRLDAGLRAARIVLLGAARRWDESRESDDLPLAKLVCTRASVDATDEALRIAGGPGFLTGPMERAFRDARAGLINPPLEDVALIGFAKALLERERQRQ